LHLASRPFFPRCDRLNASHTFHSLHRVHRRPRSPQFSVYGRTTTPASVRRDAHRPRSTARMHSLHADCRPSLT